MAKRKVKRRRRANPLGGNMKGMVDMTTNAAGAIVGIGVAGSMMHILDK